MKTLKINIHLEHDTQTIVNGELFCFTDGKLEEPVCFGNTLVKIDAYRN